MEQNYIDVVLSWCGAIIGSAMICFGILTLKDWSMIAGMGVAFVTIIYTIIKIIKELKSFKNGKHH